jgi:hypothetical protein
VCCARTAIVRKASGNGASLPKSGLPEALYGYFDFCSTGTKTWSERSRPVNPTSSATRAISICSSGWV